MHREPTTHRSRTATLTWRMVSSPISAPSPTKAPSETRVRGPTRAPAATVAPGATDAPFPIRAVRWTRAPAAIPGRGRAAGERISSHRPSESAGESTMTAGLPAADSTDGASRAPARLVVAPAARLSFATHERPFGPASSRELTPVKRSCGSPETLPPTAAATAASVKVRGPPFGAREDGFRVVLVRDATRERIVLKRRAPRFGGLFSSPFSVLRLYEGFFVGAG